MELLNVLSQTFDHTTKIVAGVRADQLGNPTPCRDWEVRALLAHTIGVVMNMGRGASGGELLDSVNAVPLADDYGAQFRTEADRTLAAWIAHGPEGEVDIGAGLMPVSAGLRINVLDTATHAWDIARATGQAPNLPDALATTVLAVSQGVVSNELRTFAGFEPAVPVPDNASPTDQLVAFLGRRP